MSKQFWRWVQAILGVTLIVFIGLNLAEKWAEVSRPADRVAASDGSSSSRRCW